MAAAPPFALAFEEVAGLASDVAASSSFGVVHHQPAPAVAVLVAAGTVPFGEVAVVVAVAAAVVASSFEGLNSGLAPSVPVLVAAAIASSLEPESVLGL